MKKSILLTALTASLLVVSCKTTVVSAWSDDPTSIISTAISKSSKRSAGAVNTSESLSLKLNIANRNEMREPLMNGCRFEFENNDGSFLGIEIPLMQRERKEDLWNSRDQRASKNNNDKRLQKGHPKPEVTKLYLYDSVDDADINDKIAMKNGKDGFNARISISPHGYTVLITVPIVEDITSKYGIKTTGEPLKVVVSSVPMKRPGRIAGQGGRPSGMGGHGGGRPGGGRPGGMGGERAGGMGGSGRPDGNPGMLEQQSDSFSFSLVLAKETAR